MRNYQTDGLILRYYNVGEADRILTVLSSNLGKMSVVARSVRRGRSKLAGHLEPFSVVQLNLAKGRKLDVVTGAQIKDSFTLEHGDLNQMALGHLFLEMSDKLSTERMVNQLLYDLLIEVLSEIPHAELDILRHYFYIKALAAIGQSPNIEQVTGQGDYKFDLEQGAVLPADKSVGLPIDALVVKLWRVILTQPFEQIAKVNIPSQTLFDGQVLIDKFYRYHINLSFRSESVLLS